MELETDGITGVRVPERTPPDRDEKVEVSDSSGSKVVPGEYEVRQSPNFMGYATPTARPTRPETP